MTFVRVFDAPVPHQVAGTGWSSLTLDVDGFLTQLDTTNPVLDDADEEDWVLYLKDIAESAIAMLKGGFASKDRYLMMSLMQKGVRRRDWRWAAKGCHSLVEMGRRQDAARRLHIIALEDVGNGDPEAGALAQMLLQSSGLRKKFGDDVVTLMACRVLTMAWKARDCNDMLAWAHYHIEQEFKEFKAEHLPDDQESLQLIALDPSLFLKMRLAASDKLPVPARLEIARELRVPASFIYSMDMSRKKSGFDFTSVAPFAALMTQNPKMVGDVYPIFGDLVKGNLAAAYDRYTSTGKAALRVFARLAELKKWFADHPHVADKDEAIFGAAFYAEGALVCPRISYDRSLDLYYSALEAKSVKQGFASLDEMLELYDLALQFLPRLNRLRTSTGNDRPHDKGVL